MASRSCSTPGVGPSWLVVGRRCTDRAQGHRQVDLDGAAASVAAGDCRRSRPGLRRSRWAVPFQQSRLSSVLRTCRAGRRRRPAMGGRPESTAAARRGARSLAMHPLRLHRRRHLPRPLQGPHPPLLPRRCLHHCRCNLRSRRRPPRPSLPGRSCSKSRRPSRRTAVRAQKTAPTPNGSPGRSALAPRRRLATRRRRVRSARSRRDRT